LNRISGTTLDVLFKKKLYKLKNVREVRSKVLQRERVPGSIVQPTIAEQAPPAMSPTLSEWIEFRDVLRAHHHPRPPRLYKRLIIQSVNENRADEAANVYVGLVEDWIMEGRIAEGADPTDLGRSGLPARNRSALKSKQGLFDTWFGTVRTWRLPGEALSLHDRLDLWHPQHAAPDKRLRGFPLPNPTSPPSYVPPPEIELLLFILRFLHLDPLTSSPAEYATSMRALAILANTILSRSLPIPAIPRLLKAFSDSRVHPAVYPLGIATPPERDAWAYTANTQVHVALVTLMFSPPNYALAAEMQRRPISKYLPLPEGAAQYTLHPLGWQSCMVLINYAAVKLRRPRLIGTLLDYMGTTFEGWSSSVFTRIFRSSTSSGDKAVARQVEHAIFQTSPLSAENIGATADAIGYEPSPVARPPKHDSPLPEPTGEPILTLPETLPSPDATSIAAMIENMTAHKEFERLRKTVHVLIPFLTINLNTPEAHVERIADITGAMIGFHGRLRPSELTPALYTSILTGLAKAGSTGLAQRVFLLAEQAERSYARRMLLMAQERAEAEGKNPTDAMVPVESLLNVRLPIQAYTAMMYLYANETMKPGARLGWNVPTNLRLLSRRDAALEMARRMYLHVQRRCDRLPEAERSLAKHMLPDSRFFNATIRVLGTEWELRSRTGEELPLQRRTEMLAILHDMAAAHIVPPRGLIEKVNKPYRVSSPVFLHAPAPGTMPSQDVPPHIRDLCIDVSDAYARHVKFDPDWEAEWTTDPLEADDLDDFAKSV
jgi:hypothetical protein